ncbi:MAG: DUF2007 domain-containing protein [Gammaproteobacteria bacterium]
MKLVFRASDINEAHIVSGMLRANGIESHVGGYYLQGGIGELAAQDFATVLVADTDVESAKAIIAEYENASQDTDNDVAQSSNTTFLLSIVLFLLLVIVIFYFLTTMP